MSILSQFKQSQNTDFPNVRPSLDLRFALAKKLDPRITFTRGSTGTYFGSDGIMRTAGVNEPRFDHDPITGQSLGLLVEGSRTNLIASSNSFGAGDGFSYAITANATTSPDGTTNASLLYERVYYGFRLHNAGFTAVIGTTYCGSAFVKYAGSSKYGRIKIGSTNTIIINLTNGAILSSTGTCGVIPYPNGWYRIYSIFTATSTSENLQIFLLNNTATSQYQGDGSSGYYVYGMQVETGAFPTSYIPTTASTVTRSADNASMTGTNFSSWYNLTEGTLYATFINNTSSDTDSSGFGRGVVAISNGTITERIRFGTTALGSSIAAIYISSNVTQSSLSTQNYTSGSKISISSSYKINYFTLARNNFAIQSNTKGSLPNVSQLELGRSTPGSGILNGTISRLTYYPIQLTNKQLINLTS